MARHPSTSPAEQRLAHYLDRYVSENPKSNEHHVHASHVLGGGTTRAMLHYPPFPLALSGGRECFVTSLDGDEYLDYVTEFTAGMLGHNHPDIVHAVEEVSKTGFALGGPHDNEAEFARRLVERFTSMDRVRFTNSGTEANMIAIATALSYTQRKKVLVFENGYHGSTLSFSKMNPLVLPHQFIFAKYNDVESVRHKLEIDVGCIILEPIQFAGGLVQATPAFLRYLRDEATRIGAVLIIDEVVTARLHYGGLQEVLGIRPDMVTLGKQFAGGLPFGALGGRREIMDLFDPASPRFLWHSGTWNNNAFTMAAGVAATKVLSHEALERCNQLGDKLRRAMTEIFAPKQDVITVVGRGSLVGLRFSGPEAEHLRHLFFYYMLSRNIYVGVRGYLALSLMHREEHIDRTIQSMEGFLHDALCGANSLDHSAHLSKPL